MFHSEYTSMILVKIPSSWTTGTKSVKAKETALMKYLIIQGLF